MSHPTEEYPDDPEQPLTPPCPADSPSYNGNCTFARRYLDMSTTDDYLEGINPGAPDALAEAQLKLSRLTEHLPAPGSVVSVGTGSGLELLALAQLYGGGTTIYGLDLSASALAATKKLLDKHHLSARLIEGSATDMPFPDGTIDGFVLSAVMHEIYSYMPDGKLAWQQAIAQIALKGAAGSKTLLRDFAAPSQRGLAKLTLTSDESQAFYDYFSRYYRTFQGSHTDAQNQFSEQRLPYDNDLPKPTASGVVEIDLDSATEVLLHFRNYCADSGRGVEVLGNPDWKEINETYLPPCPNLPGIIPMSPSQYSFMVTGIGTQALQGTGYRLRVINTALPTRPQVVELLSQHFKIKLLDIPKMPSEAVISGCTSKMEMVLSKEPIIPQGE